MMKRCDIPTFGPLAGVRVINHGTNMAGPVACDLMADWGADVIWVENLRAPDACRTSTLGEADRRNMRSICIDPVGNKEAFLKLLVSADIVIEATKGGQYDRWGLSDEVLWSYNPKLVIVHLSGFGQSGDPDYISRPAYDPIAQAFGCNTQFNGFPDRDPIIAGMFIGDYHPSMFALGSALAALYRAEKTGKGESIDVAQYEALLRLQGRYPSGYLTKGIKVGPEGRPGTANDRFAGWGQYRCQDGKLVYICPFGVTPFKNTIKFLGLEYGGEEYPAGTVFCITSKVEASRKLIQALTDFCASKPARQVEDEMVAAGIPCQMVFTYEDAEVNPHYIARETFTSWVNPRGETITGVNVIPKFKQEPGRIWRGMPGLGEDNDDILAELGYSDAEIAGMYENKFLQKK